MPDISAQSFSASASAQGYLHQVLMGLYVLLEHEDEYLAIESLDDLTLFEGENEDPATLLQVKHHTNRANLSDSSLDLWKTLRIWIHQFNSADVDTRKTHLHLITTATASPGSAASNLRVAPNRNIEEAHRKLLHVVGASKNKELKSKYFPPFVALGRSEQLNLLSRLTISDSSPNILDTLMEINKRLSVATHRERRTALVDRVQGWWLRRAVENLRDETDKISGRELFSQIANIVDQLKPDALPIDFFDAAPSKELSKEYLRNKFVAQLNEISVNPRRIELAMADYYKAFEQRSRWVRDDLLLGEDLDIYERRLIDEWERFKLSLEDEVDLAGVSEEHLQEMGRRLLNWMEQVADVRIRPNVTEGYVMRGSYHLLADKDPPQVWWHPLFLEKIEAVLEGRA